MDNVDEQAAAIRRELDGRKHSAEKIEIQNRFPRFYCRTEVERELQRLYIDELRQQVRKPFLFLLLTKYHVTQNHFLIFY